MRPVTLSALALVACGCAAPSSPSSRPTDEPPAKTNVASPRFASGAFAVTSTSTRVDLPARASAPFRVTDVASGAVVEAAPIGLSDATATTTSDGAVYADEHVSVRHRVGAFGTEDFISFEAAPAVEELRYEVALSDAIVGLRLVANAVEFLDAGGAPRLRVAPPYVIDGSGKQHAATLAITGCDYDVNAAGPWGRPVTQPGARHCEIDVRWGNAISAPIAYPATVDPAWMSTGVMMNRRSAHTANLLMTGKVLAAGGSSGSMDELTNTAELYDASTGTWANTGTMSNARANHTATTLDDGTVVVAGGAGGSLVTEVYDPTTGGWTNVGPLHFARATHTATLLKNGHVLVAGGVGSASAEIFSPGSGTWSDTGSFSSPRAEAASALLGDGTVLLAGGFDNSNVSLATTEIFDPTMGTWSPGPPMNDARAGHTATVLSNGKVLVVGGNAGAIFLATAEVYDGGNGWQSTGSLTDKRSLHAATLLTDGSVLAMGGATQSGVVQSAERWTAASGQWSSAGDMTTARATFPASRLTDGRVLVLGGHTNQVGGNLQVCEIYTPPTGSGGGGAGPGSGGAGPAGSGGAQGSGGHPGHGGGASACVPGQQVACACPGGTKGVQDCNADGTGFDKCQCEASGAGGGGGSAESSGGCGCRVGADDSSLAWPLLLGALGLAARRRRARVS